MSWVTVVCATVAAACLTLSAVHAVIWLKDRTSKANLGFSILAVGVALFTWAELAMMQARTVDEFAFAERWLNVPIYLMVVGVVTFVWQFFGTGRPWLGHAAWIVRAPTLVVNFVQSPSMDYVSISKLRYVEFLGEPVAVAEATTSAWHWFGQISYWCVLAFVIDASLTLWRQGTPEARRRAIVIGGSTALFVAMGATWASLVFANLVWWPHVEFLFFVAVVVAMAYELGRDVLRSATLARELQVSEAALRDTERRMAMAADAAHALSGRLINAQEDERRRIARDLHDDLNQRLALLSVQMELLGRDGAQARPGERATQIAAQIRDLSTEVHKLSYQLHPAKLDQLGLVAAARSWCRDATQQSGVQIAFTARDVPSDLQPDVALCLYRVLQESSGNVIRHSGATSASVELTSDPGAVRLVVRDTGRGFDVDLARRNGGLGLLGMQERVWLLHGTIAVESSPGAGTRIDVTLPLTPGHE